jgi:hypothetical protein
MNTLKPGTAAAVLLLALLLAGCKNLFHPEGPITNNPITSDPTTTSPKNEDDGKTRVYFVNGNDFSVSVYSDSARLNQFTTTGVRSESGRIETEPNSAAVFYVSYRILIDDITLAYDGPGLYARIDAGKTTGVTIPSLSELNAGELTAPLSDQAHIKIQNAGTSSLVLKYNGSEVNPQGTGSFIVNNGETARYAVDGGPASSYSFMKNTSTPLPFPTGLTNFTPGRLYSFKFDGTGLTLLAEKPLTIAQALSIVPPENISATSLTNGHISLTWDRAGTETGYGIYRSESAGGPYTSIGKTEVTSYTDTAVEIWSTYYYRISAVHNNVESEESHTVVSAQAKLDSLSSPLGLGVSGKTDNNISLSWPAVSGATSYKVYQGTSSGTVNQYVAETASTSYTVTGLTPNTGYYFTVSAVHESVESLPSAAVQGRTLNQYTVTFNADGGSPATQTRTVGSGLSLSSSNMPSAPTRTECVFGGWYTAANGGGSAFTAGTPVSGNMTVYAWWKMPDNLSLDAALAWIGNHAVTGDTYTLMLKNNETISPKSLSYSGKTVGITLNGGTTERTVSLSTTGSLFTVGSGVTLILDNNVTLQGRSDNTASLVIVSSGGTLVMNTGSKINGNTFSSQSSSGGGVYVAEGTFTMSGGTISGNTSLFGGGVCVSGGTFTMSGGTISGNTSSSYSSSSSACSSFGGGVYVGGGKFTMSGGTISGNTSSSPISSSGGGVYVVDGTFTKQSGGVIYGSNENNNALKNTATSGNGHAVYVNSSPAKKRNTTAGSEVTLNSNTAGDWE